MIASNTRRCPKVEKIVCLKNVKRKKGAEQC